MTDARPPVSSPPVLCLVTPGPRRAAAGVDALTGLVDRAIDAGIDLVQLREPQLSGRELCEVAAQAVRRSRGTATRVVVNDRLDVALAAGADGVHLGLRSLPPARVRDIVPRGFLVGCSVHSLDELRRVVPSGVDYVVAGTVYRTASKPPGTPVMGLNGLAALVRATTLPILAIGGITLERLPEVAASGAAGFAAIALFADAEASRLTALVAEARRALTRLEHSPKLSRTDDLGVSRSPDGTTR